MSNTPVALQNKFVAHCTANMLKVLMNCIRKKEDCACTIQVSYVDDPKIPENARYKTSIYCAQRDDPFFEQSVKNLAKVNEQIDPLKK